MQYINLFLIRQDVLSLLEFSMFSLSKSWPDALLEKIAILLAGSCGQIQMQRNFQIHNAHLQDLAPTN